MKHGVWLSLAIQLMLWTGIRGPKSTCGPPPLFMYIIILVYVKTRGHFLGASYLFGLFSCYKHWLRTKRVGSGDRPARLGTRLSLPPQHWGDKCKPAPLALTHTFSLTLVSWPYLKLWPVRSREKSTEFRVRQIRPNPSLLYQHAAWHLKLSAVSSCFNFLTSTVPDCYEI